MSPANVAADRSNLADSCLVLVLLSATWALLRSLETRRLRWLWLGMGLVGLGFNVKMLAAYMVLPGFYLVYWLSAPVSRPARVARLLVATVILVAVSLVWPAIVDLTPPESRPHVGDTRDNSALSLALGSKGLNNVAGRREGSGPPPALGPAHARRQRPPRVPDELADHGARTGSQSAPGNRTTHGGLTMIGHGGSPGLLRLANRDLAGHLAWIIPYAAIGLLVVPMYSRLCLPLSPLYRQLALWIAWFGMYAVVFSFARAPIHPHYLSVLAPPVAATVGISTVYLWRAAQQGGRWLAWPLLALVLTAICQWWILGYWPDWRGRLVGVPAMGFVLGLAILLGGQARKSASEFGRRARLGAMVLGLATLLMCPAVWSSIPAISPGARMVPLADPALLDHRSRSVADVRPAVEALSDFLRAERAGSRFLVGVPDVHMGAPMIIETGEPVMAYGGFSGVDPGLTVRRLEDLVAAAQVRFFLLPSGPAVMPTGAQDPIAAWVRAHGRVVAARQWKHSSIVEDPGPAGPLCGWGPVGDLLYSLYADPDLTLYDCRPRGSR